MMWQCNGCDYKQAGERPPDQCLRCNGHAFHLERDHDQWVQDQLEKHARAGRISIVTMRDL